MDLELIPHQDEQCPGEFQPRGGKYFRCGICKIAKKAASRIAKPDNGLEMSQLQQAERNQSDQSKSFANNSLQSSLKKPKVFGDASYERLKSINLKSSLK